MVIGNEVQGDAVLEPRLESGEHESSRPGSTRALLLVNQNLVVTDGSTKALKTSATGRRISIFAWTTGAF